MKLHLVRHGATFSSGQTYAGRSDIPLTPDGHRQAEAVADEMQDRPIGLILASPLSRAVDTARPLAKRLGLEIRIEPALTEFDFGDYEGRPKAETGLHLRKAHLVDPVPGGESLQDVWIRAGAVLATVQEQSSRLNCIEAACFGHFWINRLVFGRSALLDFETSCRSRDYRPKTGEIRTIKLPEWAHIARQR